MSYTIATDTSANLPSLMLKEKGIAVVPFSYFIDGRTYHCLNTEAFNGARFYDAIRDGVRVTTSQINPQEYMDFFRPFLENGEDVLYIAMSSGISGSCQSARLAAEQLKQKYPARTVCVVDTLGASLGEGIPVLKAAQFRAQGVGLEENMRRIEAMCRRMYQVFVVDDLMHLRRSGRLSGTAAIVGTVLQIKPLLKGNEEGKIVSFAKVRGRRKAMEALAEKYDSLAIMPSLQTVGIAHADNPEDAAYLAALLRRKRPPGRILTVCYEPVTGSHVGPDTVALFFESDDTVRGK